MFWAKKKKLVENKGSDNAQLFKRRMQIIKSIADKNMKTAQCGGHFPIRDHVVIEWEELLKIWDIADKALFETPVED